MTQLSPEIHLSLSFFEGVLINQETEFSTTKDLNKIEQSVKNYIKRLNFSPSHQIVYGIILLQSTDEYLSRIGFDVCSKYLRNISDSDFEALLKLLDDCEQDLRYHVLSIISLENNKLDLPEHLIKQIQHYLKCCILSKNDHEEFFVFQLLSIDDGIIARNQLLDSIEASIKSGNGVIDYFLMVSQLFDEINTMVIGECLVFLSGLPRIANVHCANFLDSLHKNGIFIGDSNIDALYIHKNDLNFERVSTIVHAHKVAYKQLYPVRYIYKYKKDFDFIIWFVEASLFLSEALYFTEIPFTPVDMTYAGESYELVPNWSSCQFISLLIALLSYFPDKVQKYFRHGMQTYPHYIFIGILQQPHLEITDHLRKVLHELVLTFIKTEKYSIDVLRSGWNIGEYNLITQPLIIQSIQEYFCSGLSDLHSRIFKILDIAQSLQALDVLLKSSSYTLVVELAIAAAQKKLILIGHFLLDKFLLNNDAFILALFSSLQKRYPFLFAADVKAIPVTDIHAIKLDHEYIDDVILFIDLNKNKLSHEFKEKTNEILRNYRLIWEGQPLWTVALDRTKQEHGAKLFTLLLSTNGDTTYDGKYPTVKAFLESAGCLDGSADFSVAYTYLMDALTNISYYPFIKDHDLHTISVALFILVERRILPISKLSEILDTFVLQNPVNSRYFYLAVILIGCDVKLLVEIPDMCQRWYRSNVFISLPPFIRIPIEYIVHQNKIPFAPDGELCITDPHLSRSRHSSYITEMMSLRYDYNYNALSIKGEIDLYNCCLSSPAIIGSNPPTYSETIYEELGNILNDNELNVTLLENLLQEKDFEWFAEYLVRELIPYQPQFTNFYHKLLFALNNESLYTLVRWHVDKFIKELLIKIKGNSSQKEICMLNCLGAFFGHITIKENRSLTHSELNIKLLLMEASFKSQDDLEIILHFVRVFLLNAKETIVFVPSNPWILGISSVLSDIFMRNDLRSSIRFEIESLARVLGIYIKSVNPSVYSSISDIIERVNPYLIWSEKEKDILLFRLRFNDYEDIYYEKLDVTSFSRCVEMLNLSKCPSEYQKLVCDGYANLLRESCDWLLDKVCRPVCGLVESVIKEDFRNIPDEVRMANSAHSMTISVCLSYATVLIKNFHFLELTSLTRHHLIDSFHSDFQRNKTRVEKCFVDSIIFDVAQDNVDLLCTYLIKYCTEKVIQSVDKRLSQEYDYRRYNREKSSFQSRPSSVPSVVEKRVSKFPTFAQLNVYNEFNKHTPGFNDITKNYTDKSSVGSDSGDKLFLAELTLNQQKFVLNILRASTAKVYRILSVSKTSEKFASLILLLQTTQICVTNVSIHQLPSIIQMTVCCYFEYMNKQKTAEEAIYQQLLDSLLDILLMLEDSKVIRKIFVNCITRIVMDLSWEERDNVEAMSILISKRLLNVRHIDYKLYCDLMNRKHTFENDIQFVLQLLRSLMVDECHRGVASEYEFSNCIRLANKLINTYKDGEKNKLDNNNIYVMECAETVLRDWVRFYYSNNDNDQDTNFKIFVANMSRYNVLQSEDRLIDFVETSFEICMSLSLMSEDEHSLLRPFQIIDSFINLLVQLIKFYGSTEVTTIVASKMNLFTRILFTFHKLTMTEFINCSKLFRCRTTERVITAFILELSRQDRLLEEIRNYSFIALLGFLHTLSPDIQPEFVFSFFTIISNESLIVSSLCYGPTSKSASLYCTLLSDFIRFLQPFMITDNNDIDEIVLLITQFTQLILNIGNFYPHFISYYYLSLLNDIPPECILLRNIVLSVIPSEYEIEFENEQNLSPQVFIFLPRYIPLALIKSTQSYLSHKEPTNYLTQLLVYFENGYRFDKSSSGLDFLNAFVFHIGSSGANEIHFKGDPFSIETVQQTVPFEILLFLLHNLTLSTRFSLITSIVNNIRFPSTHSKFFIYSLLSFLLSTTDETIRDTIYRSLFERAGVKGPHPLGLLFVLKTILKSPLYKLYKLTSVKNHQLQNIIDNLCKEFSLPRPSQKTH